MLLKKKTQIDHKSKKGKKKRSTSLITGKLQMKTKLRTGM